MAFFRKRALSPVERFESALKEKQAARESLAELPKRRLEKDGKRLNGWRSPAPPTPSLIEQRPTCVPPRTAPRP